MQSIQKIIKNSPTEIHSALPKKTMQKTQATSSSCRNIAKASKRIDGLFSRFAAIYGHVWRSQFKDEDYFLPFAKKEWQVALLQNAQHQAQDAQPPTREEMAARLKQKQQAEREIYSHAGLETVHLDRKSVV